MNVKSINQKIDGKTYWTRLLDRAITDRKMPSITIKFAMEALQNIGVCDLSAWDCLRVRVGFPDDLQ